MKAERMLFELDECKFRAAPSSAAEDKTALLIGLTKREMKIRSQKYERELVAAFSREVYLGQKSYA